MLVVERARIFLAFEIASLPAPVGPGAGEPMNDLPCGGFPAEAILLCNGFERFLIGGRPLQPGRNAALLDAHENFGNPGAAQVLLCEDVRSNLAPVSGNLNLGCLENDRAIGISDLAGGTAKFDPVEGELSGFGEAPLDVHGSPRLVGPVAQRSPNPRHPTVTCGPSNPRLEIHLTCPTETMSRRRLASVLFGSAYRRSCTGCAWRHPIRPLTRWNCMPKPCSRQQLVTNEQLLQHVVSTA